MAEQLRRIFEAIVLGIEAVLETAIDAADRFIALVVELFKNDLVRLFAVYFILLVIYLFV